MTRRPRTWGTTLATAGLIALSGLPAQASQPTTDTASQTSPAFRVGCMPQTYQGRYRVTSYHRTPVIAHASGLVLGPSGSHKVTKTAAFETRVTAGAELNVGGSVGADTVFAKVEGHFDVTVKVEGSSTRSGSIQVTDVVSNPTRHNKKYIAFDGVTKYFGTYFLKTCGRDHQVHRLHGHYRTYNNYTEGIPRCGAGDAGSAITHLALKRCGL